MRVHVCPSYKDILELALFCIYSERNYGKSNILIAEIRNCHFCVQNEWKTVRQWHHQLTHSFAYSYRLVKKCFLKICKTSKCHNFLIFQLIFIKFSLFVQSCLLFSSEIKLYLFRTSPLNGCQIYQLVWPALVPFRDHVCFNIPIFLYIKCYAVSGELVFFETNSSLIFIDNYIDARQYTVELQLIDIWKNFERLKSTLS